MELHAAGRVEDSGAADADVIRMPTRTEQAQSSGQSPSRRSASMVEVMAPLGLFTSLPTRFASDKAVRNAYTARASGPPAPEACSINSGRASTSARAAETGSVRGCAMMPE